MTDVKSHLQLAIAAARAGKIVEARILAEKVLNREPENVNALLLVGTLCESQEEQANYLNQVLAIDPDHEVARERLRQLDMPAEFEHTVQEEKIPDEPTVLPIEELPETVIGEVRQAPPEDIEDYIVDELDQTWLEEFDVAPVTEIEQLLQEETPPTMIQPAPAETRLSFEEQEEGETIPSWLIDEGGFEDKTLLMTEEPTRSAQPVDEQEIPDWLFAEPDEEWPETRPGISGTGEEAVLVEAQPAAAQEPEPKARSKPRVSNRGLEVLLVLLIILALVIVAGLVFLIVNPI